MLVRPVSVQAPSQSSGSYVDGPGDTGFYNSPSYPGGSTDKVGAALTDGSGITIASNQTYSNYKNLAFGQIGTPSVPVHDVVFNNCCWESSGYNAPNVILCTDGPATFNWCTIRPVGVSDNTVRPSQLVGYQYGILADGTVAVPGTYNSFQGGTGACTFSRCDIWGFANATKTAQSAAARPLVFDRCWVHMSRSNDDTLDHTDGIGCPSGDVARYVTIDRCRVEDIGDTNGLAYQNTPGPSVWENFTVTNNLFGGWGYTINISGGTAASPNGGANIIFTDNTFSTLIRPIYGPLYGTEFAPSNNGNLWRRNKWLVPAGAAWGNVANSGKFWIPEGAQIIGSNDAPFVSDTDYTG